MFLDRGEITRRSREIFEDGEFLERNLKQASYDMRLGSPAYLSNEEAPKALTEDAPYLSILSGEFALLQAYEKVRIPNDLIAFIAIRSRYKFRGLINISGFHVDPTYEGHLTFSVQNVGPNQIILQYGEPVFSIFFAELKGKIDPEKRRPEKKEDQGITLEQISQLGGTSVTLANLKRDLESLRMLVKVYAPIAVTLVVLLIGLIFRKQIFP